MKVNTFLLKDFIMFKKDAIKLIFNKQNIIDYLKISVIVFISLTIVNIITIYSMYDTSLKKYIKRLTVIEKFNGDDINLLCNTITCKKVLVINETVYVSRNGILKRSEEDKNIFNPEFIDIFNKDYDTIVKFNDLIFLVDDSAYFNSVNYIMLINYFFIFLFFTTPFIVFKYEKGKILEIKDRVTAENLSINLQRDLSESLNHELTLPVVMIKTNLMQLYKGLNIKKDCGLTCKFKKEAISKDKLDELYNSSMLSIETIEEVLKTISDSKKIVSNSRNTPILDILATVESYVNSLSVNNIDIEVKTGRDIIRRYRACRELGNGKLSRIFKNHIVNSKEAKASKILFLFKLLENNLMEVIIIDNGMGIRDNDNDILKDISIIFKQGITTKKDNNEIASTVEELSKSRGIGMYINKKELEHVGGSIEVLKTSRQGTIFRLVFPVYEINTYKDKQYEKNK
jgi:signal transduction histidine kinase